MSLLETFRLLASLAPARASLAGAPWERYVDWAISQGLAPLAAYNLEYRLGGAFAPEWARERLLSVYQGSVNDNVMKLVNFKRAIGDLEGRRIVVLGGASFAEALYPHVAFRPVAEIRLLVHPQDLEGLTGFLGASFFRAAPDLDDPAGADRALSDGRTAIFLHSHLVGRSWGPLEDSLLSRALPFRVYGPSVLRLDLEDALLALCLEQARAGYEVPMLSFVDLRELLLGAPTLSGPYSRPPDLALVRRRAAEWGAERALYASLAITARLFPEVAEQAGGASPELRRASRALIDRLVVGPAAEVGRTRAIRGGDRLRRLLAGRPGHIT